jgi:zinc transport system ATP-binding protein
VLIARALAAEAELLVLDEPTAGVDAATQEHLTDTMAALAAQQVTIVLVAHELGPAADVVTRAVQLRDGAIVYDGAPRPVDVHVHDFGHHHVEEPPARPGPFGLTG